MDNVLLLIPLLPFAGAIINGTRAFARPLQPKNRAVTNFFALASTGLSALLAAWVAFSYSTPWEHVYFAWIPAGIGHVTGGFLSNFLINFALRVDPLSITMLLIVTWVGFLIHIYATGYMSHETGYTRFFTYLNLFMFMMLLLVLGANYVVMFVGWEGVGLCSYLLIGFYYDKNFAADAGKKAFVANRIGDFGFILGIFLIFNTFGSADYAKVFPVAAAHPAQYAGIATAICLLLFVGACGKSAQIPLYVWLPDAMAGPTPVSALIHAATMVTAGVYLVARMSGVYLHAPEASAVIAAIGVGTAFFAATIALVQTDIKKVLAYSTLSQLGFMFVAAGVGAYGVAVFHLYTHAFFKACLFLGAGSVIHALSGEQDVRRMGGLARRIPVTFWTFAVATAAIAGIPPLAGFFSKDEILWFALASARGGSPVLFGVMAVTALLTSFYMFRLLWLTFLGDSRMSAEAEHHVHESPPSMTMVLVVLAALSAVGGFFSIPHVLEPMLALPAEAEGAEAWHSAVVAGSIAIAAAGLAGAAWFFGGKAERAERVRTAFPGLHRVLTNKYYVDEAYEKFLWAPLNWISERVFLGWGDRRLIDGSLHAIVALGQGTARLLSRLQTGNVHFYAFLTLAGLAAALAWSLAHA